MYFESFKQPIVTNEYHKQDPESHVSPSQTINRIKEQQDKSQVIKAKSLINTGEIEISCKWEQNTGKPLSFM